MRKLLLAILLFGNSAFCYSQSLDIQEDPITGTKIVSFNHATGDVSNMSARRAVMSAKCENGEIELSIDWAEYVSGFQITYRFGSEDADSDSFIQLINDGVIFFDNPNEILRGLLRAVNSENQVFAARVADIDGDAMTAIWNLRHPVDYEKEQHENAIRYWQEQLQGLISNTSSRLYSSRSRLQNLIERRDQALEEELAGSRAPGLLQSSDYDERIAQAERRLESEIREYREEFEKSLEGEFTERNERLQNIRDEYPTYSENEPFYNALVRQFYQQCGIDSQNSDSFEVSGGFFRNIFN